MSLLVLFDGNRRYGGKGSSNSSSRTNKPVPKREEEKDLLEQWNIKIKIFDETIELKESIYFINENKVNIEIGNSNAISEDIYDVKVSGIAIRKRKK
ncbi:MAG: hypothetical protein O3C19_01935 [Bacteroidetes bacterium]|nr:hypothetical protein [Bacteroidota bacterium]